jgi:hypothetical protein
VVGEMSKTKRSAVLGVYAFSMALLLSACGGSGGDGENDQGIVFRAEGFVRGPEAIEEDRIRCTEPTIQNAIVDAAGTIYLSGTRFFPDRNSAFGDPCGGYIALQNNLAAMAINVADILVRYEVPGAAIALPENTITLGLTIPPASSFVEPSSGQPGLVYSQLVGQIVPAQMMVFLNQNENQLPTPPYDMDAYFRARGQADNGTRYTSNEIGFRLTVSR